MRRLLDEVSTLKYQFLIPKQNSQDRTPKTPFLKPNDQRQRIEINDISNKIETSKSNGQGWNLNNKNTKAKAQ